MVPKERWQTSWHHNPVISALGRWKQEQRARVHGQSELVRPYCKTQTPKECANEVFRYKEKLDITEERFAGQEVSMGSLWAENNARWKSRSAPGMKPSHWCNVEQHGAKRRSEPTSVPRPQLHPLGGRCNVCAGGLLFLVHWKCS